MEICEIDCLILDFLIIYPKSKSQFYISNRIQFVYPLIPKYKQVQANMFQLNNMLDFMQDKDLSVKSTCKKCWSVQNASLGNIMKSYPTNCRVESFTLSYSKLHLFGD